MTDEERNLYEACKLVIAHARKNYEYLHSDIGFMPAFASPEISLDETHKIVGREAFGIVQRAEGKHPSEVSPCIPDGSK